MFQMFSIPSANCQSLLQAQLSLPDPDPLGFSMFPTMREPPRNIQKLSPKSDGNSISAIFGFLSEETLVQNNIQPNIGGPFKPRETALRWTMAMYAFLRAAVALVTVAGRTAPKNIVVVGGGPFGRGSQVTFFAGDSHYW